MDSRTAMEVIANSSSSMTLAVEDIRRIIAACDREGFDLMLQHELRGFPEPLPPEELRRVAVNVWHRFLKYGWTREG